MGQSLPACMLAGYKVLLNVALGGVGGLMCAREGRVDVCYVGPLEWIGCLLGDFCIVSVKAYWLCMY